MLTEQQQEFWGHFKWDPASFAHRTARRVNSATIKQKITIIDQAFTELLDRESDPWVISRVAKTWLTGYRLPVEPDKIQRFDEFHQRVRSIALDETLRSQLEIYRNG
jgi:hypothetical protein